MELLRGIGIILVSVIWGLMTIGLGQVFKALREVALNTRIMASTVHGAPTPQTETYQGLTTIASVFLVCGILTIFGGVLAGGIAVLAGLNAT